MKSITIPAAIVALCIAATTAFASTSVETYSRVEVAKTDTPDPLSYQQRAWLGALMWCESRGNPEAVNPQDTDNTPSYGILQFKPGTFSDFAPKYGITTKDYKDPDAQIAIVEYWIMHPGEVKWQNQFPGCVKKLGVPPKLSTSTIDKKL